MSATLIIWIFAMRILMILTSLVSYFINKGITNSVYGDKKKFDFEQPLTNLVWITSSISIIVTFWASYVLLGDQNAKYPGLWWALAIIISCGTIAGALIPEFTKVFTSTKSRHVQEVVGAARHGGASLDILSGFVAGNFSAFWEGLTILVLMFIAYLVSQHAASWLLCPTEFVFAAPVFAFGLVAFGFLGMGPVTIAVDSFGPVSDNAQSVYELSRIETYPQHQGRNQKRVRLRARFRKRQGLSRRGRRSRKYLQGNGKTGAYRYGSRRCNHHGLRHHHPPGKPVRQRHRQT